MYPEPPPYHPPVAAPDPLLPAAPPAAPPAAAPRRNRVLITLGSIVTVGLVGLGAAAIALGGGGASSPEEAVQHLAAAIDDQDVLAAVATLAPDETRSLPDLVDRFTAKAKELDLGSRFDAAMQGDDEGTTTAPKQSDPAGPLGGLDVEVSGLELRTVRLSDDIAKVEVVDGTITWDLPEGEELSNVGPSIFGRGLFPGSTGDWCSFDGSDSESSDSETDDATAECEREQADAAERMSHGEIDLGKLHDRASGKRPGVFVMTVDRDGWYVSPLFTAAEYARVATESPILVDYHDDPGPAAGSPTDAVRALAGALETTDPDRIANVLSSELSVWRVYSRTFADAEDSIDDEIESMSVSDLATHEEPIDDERVRVVIDKAHLKVVVNEPDYNAYPDDPSYDEFDDFNVDDLPKVKVTQDVKIDGDCFTASSSDGGDPEEVCLDTTADGVVKALGVNRVALVAVTDRDGWAVSPIETVADYLRTVVDHIDGPLFDRITDGFGAEPSSADVTATLDEGDNEIPLDSAGSAVVAADVDDGDFARITSDDDDVTVSTGDYGAAIVGPGKHTFRVTAPIGTKQATVQLLPIEITDLTAANPDGSRHEQITKRVRPDEVHGYRMSAADYRLTDIAVGPSLLKDDFDGEGEYTYVDADTDDDETIVTIFSPDSSTPPTEAEDDQYTLSFFGPATGFAGPDATTATIDVGGESSYYNSVALHVADGPAFDLAIDAPIALDVTLYCDSGQFDPPFDENADVPDPEMEWTAPYHVVAGVPFSTRLTPVTSETCTVDLAPADDGTGSEGIPPSAPVVLHVVPAA